MKYGLQTDCLIAQLPVKGIIYSLMWTFPGFGRIIQPFLALSRSGRTPKNAFPVCFLHHIKVISNLQWVSQLVKTCSLSFSGLLFGISVLLADHLMGLLPPLLSFSLSTAAGATSIFAFSSSHNSGPGSRRVIWSKFSGLNFASYVSVKIKEWKYCYKEKSINYINYINYIKLAT